PYYGAATPALDVTPYFDGVTCPSGTGPAGSASCNNPNKLAPGVVSIGTINPTTGIMSRPLNGDTGAVTGGAGVEFTPTNDIFMYARYSRGYEAMSFNAGYISANPETKPEFLNSYEVGYKETFGTKLLIDMAIFYYDYDQFQVPLSVNVGGVTSSQFINVPKAESTGVELEADWTPTKDWLISLSYSYDYTSILTGCSGTVSGTNFIAAPGALCVEDTNDPDAVQPQARPFPGQSLVNSAGAENVRLQSVQGDPLPDAPRNKIALNAAYTWHWEPGSFTLSGQFIWRDTQDGTVFNRTYDDAPSWDGVNIRGLWKGPGDKYEVIAYVDNVFNSLQYEVGDGGAGLLGNATSATATQACTAMACPRALLNEVNVFTLAPPRTYGLEVRYKFF
ncbi:MAG TPA: TonB-dependent receptor, partial [Caulobacteraceae bacterium]|nr:TonB-dependent receptor [Caulobacteraceae bacterium]